MKRVRWVLIALALLLILPRAAMAMTAQEIMKKVDEFQVASSVKLEAEMLIVNGKRSMTKSMTLIAQGDNALVTFTNAKDRGTKFLKIKDDLWMFFPDAEETVKISGHMLEQGLMGSDFSYQDAMEEERLSELYQFTMIREEKIGERPCYVIEAVAKSGVKATYYRRVSWVDRERFVILKEELYAQSGRLLKLMTANQVEKIGSRWYVTDSVMENKLKKDTKTGFRVISVEFDVKIPADTFSLKNLR